MSRFLLRPWWAFIAHVLVHVGALLPLLWLVWAIPSGVLGGDPIKELTHFLGLGALRLLLLSLMVSPFVKRFRLGVLMRLRRPLGLWCFAWASLHFSVWLYLDLGFQWPLIGAEIVERTYILVGFVSWCLLLALAVTSLPRLMRRMGRHWKTLHSAVYWILPLALLHFVWSLKSGWFEPAMYIIWALLILWPRRRKVTKFWRQAKSVVAS